MHAKSPPKDTSPSGSWPVAIPQQSMLLLWRNIIRAFLAHGQRWELPPNVGMVLIHLHVHPEDGEPSILSELVHYPRQTMTFMLDTLEAKGLAVRRPHPSDRRRKRIELTRAGTILGARLFKDLLEFEAVALAAIPSGKLETFKNLVECYADALDRQNRGGSGQ